MSAGSAGDGSAARRESAVAVASAFPRVSLGEVCPYLEEVTREVRESGLLLAPPAARTRACTIPSLLKSTSFQTAYSKCQRLSGEARVRAVTRLLEEYCNTTERTAYEAVLLDGALIDDETPSRSLIQTPTKALQTRLLACPFDVRPAPGGVEIVWTPPPRLAADPRDGVAFVESLERETIAVWADGEGRAGASSPEGADAMDALEHALTCALPAPPHDRVQNAQGGILGEITRGVRCEMVPAERLGDAIGEKAAARVPLAGAERIVVTRDADRASSAGSAAVIEVIALKQDERSPEVFTASVAYEDMPGVRDTQFSIACVRERLASTGAACLQTGPDAPPRLKEAIVREGGFAGQGGAGVMMLL